MASALPWGHLTLLKYLHHKQHELWGLQEGRYFKNTVSFIFICWGSQELANRRAVYKN